MASPYNKPGVYVEETLTPSVQVITAPGQTNAVFVGVTDRGPTASVGGNIVGIPTLVGSWSDFVNAFSFGSTVDVFSNTANASSEAMRYALYTYFQNGGSQAYILRTPNTDASTASITINPVNTRSSVTATVTATAATNAIDITLSSGLDSAAVATGAAVTLSGFTTATVLNDTWVIASVTSTTRFTVTATGVASTNETKVGVVATAVSPQTTTPKALKVSANSAGTWADNVYVATQRVGTTNYFDLLVYYKPGATSATVTDASRVERWPNLSLDINDARYAPNIVNSQWVSVSVTGTTGSVPLDTYYQNTTSDLNAGPLAVKGSVWFNSNWGSSAAGGDGTTAPAIATTTARIDSVAGPVLINYPATTATTVIDGLTSYAAGRGDAFVVVDPNPTTTVASAVATAAAYGTTYGSYGAVYYPRINITDPASKTGASKTVSPGGAVMAAYTTTDAQRGVFKAPAGTGASLKAVGVEYSLTSSDFDTVSNSATPINIIRYVPGAGFCVMGARTLSQTYSDRYIPVRRTLNYLRRNLTDITAFAVFEPNNYLTWARVTSVIENFLYSFWQKGGMYGDTPQAAYYVKCDATTNTAAAQAAGELRIEVGVALASPAEYVIIKLGQSQGGTTITTSV